MINSELTPLVAAVAFVGVTALRSVWLRRARGISAYAIDHGNPIFLGMLVFVAGMTMWSPSAVTLALLAATYVALEVQVRLEEAYLERTHGETYRAFRSRVRRWL